MTKYYALLTQSGAAKLANAAALGTKLQITHMAVGDGGGTLPTPNASQTALVAEKRRAALNALSVDAANGSQIIAEQVIPEGDGGFWIREIGLFDADGVMIAVANCPETYKPQLQEGSGRTQTVRMILIVNSTDAVTLKIDPSVVLATRKYVDEGAIVVKAYADSLMAKHLAAADPHPQYAPKASPAFSGTPTAPTAAAGNSSLQVANTAFVQAAVAALIAGSPGALDTLKELADALGGDAHFSTTVLNALAGKMDIAKNGSDISDVAKFLQNTGISLRGQRSFYTTSSWTCPAGVTKVYLDGCGGGGGGGYGAAGATGGGGGGGAETVLSREISVVPGTTYIITIASPGAGGTASSVNGTQGGTSAFDSLISLTGGFGGLSNGTSGGAGGTGGTAGIYGAYVNSTSFGGHGGQCNLGSGGPGGSGAMVGSVAGSCGAGGGGGGRGNGGNGGFGFIKIWW